MKIQLEAPDWESSEGAPVYRIRVWRHPVRLFGAWSVDDWEIRGASSIREILDVAEVEGEAGALTEVFVRAGESMPWIRIDGAPPADVETVVEVQLT